MLEVAAVLLVLIGTGALILKGVNASASLLVGGSVMLILSWLMGHSDSRTMEFDSTGSGLVDQLIVAERIIASSLTGSGLIIMVLFGYTAYMEVLGANSRTVDVLAAPLLSLRGWARIALVPLTFLLANLMSLAVPSGASLAVLLGATLLPALIGAGLTPLTAGALIATSATVMPSPLGADSIEAASQLGMSIGEYAFGNNAKVALPALVVMAVVHIVWQRYMDARDERRGVAHEGSAPTETPADHGPEGMQPSSAAKTIEKAPAVFAILPLLPLIMVLLLYVLEALGFTIVHLGLVQVTLLSLGVALIARILQKRKILELIDELKEFLLGMGRGLSTVVALIIAAGMLVEGIRQTGVLDDLLDAAANMRGGAFIILLAFVGVALLLAMLTGSGLAAFFSLITVVPSVAARTGIPGIVFALPLQHAASLGRAASPVSASTLIVCGLIKVDPPRLLARTLVPIASGVLTSITLSWTILQ